MGSLHIMIIYVEQQVIERVICLITYCNLIKILFHSSYKYLQVHI